MTNALAALVNAAPEQLARLGVDPQRSVTSIDAAKFDNRPPGTTEESSTADPAGTTGTRRSSPATDHAGWRAHPAPIEVEDTCAAPRSAT